MNITLEELRELAKEAKYKIDQIYLHWTAGDYDTTFDAYHINILGDGTIVQTCDSLTDKKAHTWRRNSCAVGVTMCCAAGAKAYKGGHVYFGDYPPTRKQIETMAKVIAVLCDELGICINEYNVMTHAEAGDLDGYGPETTCERWDLWKLQDLPGDTKLTDGGLVLRGKANWYLEKGV